MDSDNDDGDDDGEDDGRNVEDVDVKDADADDDDEDEYPVSEGGNSLMSAESVYTQIKQAHDIMQGADPLQMCNKMVIVMMIHDIIQGQPLQMCNKTMMISTVKAYQECHGWMVSMHCKIHLHLHSS